MAWAVSRGEVSSFLFLLDVFAVCLIGAHKRRGCELACFSGAHFVTVFFRLVLDGPEGNVPRKIRRRDKSTWDEQVRSSLNAATGWCFRQLSYV